MKLSTELFLQLINRNYKGRSKKSEMKIRDNILLSRRSYITYYNNILKFIYFLMGNVHRSGIFTVIYIKKVYNIYI